MGYKIPHHKKNPTMEYETLNPSRRLRNKGLAMTRDSKAEKLRNESGVVSSLVSGIYRQAVANQIVLDQVMGLITEILCNEN